MTPPTITGMKWSATELKIGDKLEVEIDASDLESGLSTKMYDLSIYIENTKTKLYKYQYLTYDDTSKN